MTCINYDEERLKMQQGLTKMCSKFINLSNRDKFIYLLTAGTEVARPVARFIEKHLPWGPAKVALLWSGMYIHLEEFDAV